MLRWDSGFFVILCFGEVWDFDVVLVFWDKKS